MPSTRNASTPAARAERHERWQHETTPASRSRLAGVFDVCGTPVVRRAGRHVALALQVRCRVRAYLDAFERFFGGRVVNATTWIVRDREDALACAETLLPLVGQRPTLSTWIELRRLVGAQGSTGLAMGAGEHAEREAMLRQFLGERRARRTRRAAFAAAR